GTAFLRAPRRPESDRAPLRPRPAAALAAPPAGAVQPQADAHRLARMPLQAIPLRGYEPVRAARAAATPPADDQPERRVPVLLQPRGPADGEAAAGGRAAPRPPAHRVGD